MLIPISHEDSTVRRQPWITYALIAACTGIFIYTHHVMGGAAEHRLLQTYTEVVQYFSEHPYLDLDPRFEKLVGDEIVQIRQAAAAAKRAQNDGSSLVVVPSARRYEQEELNRRMTYLFSAMDNHPFYRWGLIAAAAKPFGYLSYQFIHGGWLHLVGNMFLLFLMGSFIEDRWGRVLYLFFYLMAGVAGALFFTLKYPALEMPLVGASGAVAGAMGAFLIRFWKTRIRYFYWFVIFAGTFSAPAWLMLPLWFGQEYLMAKLMDSMLPGAGVGGVAHWAHVGGFFFGAAFALGIRLLRVEERYIHPAIEAKLGGISNPVLNEAMEARQRGDDERAFELLSQEFRRDTKNRDTALAFWDVAVDLQRADAAAPALLQVIREELRSDEGGNAVEYCSDLCSRARNFRVEPQLALRVVPLLKQSGRVEVAAEILERTLDGAAGNFPAPIALKLARVAQDIDAAAALTAVECVLVDIDLPPAERESAEALRAELSGRVGARKSSEGVAVLPDFDAAPVVADSVAQKQELEAENEFVLERSGEASVVTREVGLSAEVQEDVAAFIEPSAQDELSGDAFEEGAAEDLAYASAERALEVESVETELELDASELLIEETGALTEEVAEESALDLPLADTTFGALDFEEQFAKMELAPPVETWAVSDVSPAAQTPAASPVVVTSDDPDLFEFLSELRPLSVRRAIPLGFSERKLLLDIDGHGKSQIELARVEAVAVAAVCGLGGKPVIVIDLVLNWLASGETLRVMRIESNRSDPRRWTGPAENPLAALRAGIARLLEESRALSLPDFKSVSGESFRVFETLAAYEREVLLAERAADSADAQ